MTSRRHDTDSQTCPDHGLPIGSDVDNATLLRLAGHDQIADLIWEAPADFSVEHGQVCAAAIQAHLSGSNEAGERFREQVVALWSHAWSANYQALDLRQATDLIQFSPARPQRWVIASFEHHTRPHSLPHPHIHNIVVPNMTTAVRG